MRSLFSSARVRRSAGLTLALVALAVLLPPAAHAESAAAPPPAPTPAAPRRVLLIGDSFITSAFGPALEQLLGEGGALEVLRRAKTSSGLARPDFFDWWAEARGLVARHQPEVVVLMMGGNDGQDLVSSAYGPRARWRSPGWADAYRQRMLSLMETLGAPARRVVWLELPPMELRHLEGKVAFIRGLQRETIASVPGASYLPTHALLRTASGELVRSVPGPRGRPAAVRMSDGIHFTAAGGRYFAQQVAPLLREHLQRPPAEASVGAGGSAAMCLSGGSAAMR